MSLKSNLKGAMKIMALACAFAGPSLFAKVVDEQQVISGVQGKIEHLGTKATRDIQKRSVEEALITVSAVKKSNELPLQGLAKSASYNPATPFFRTGLNVDVTSISDVLRPVTPPDTNGAIGPEQFIIALNSGLRSFDRKTGLPDGILDSLVSSFFGVNSISDPHILYDHFAKVWYLVAMARDAVQGIDIVFAVSHDCVITDCTEWDFFRVPGAFLAPGEVFPALDYPLIGYDVHAVYITIDVFTSGFASFFGSGLCVFQKSSLLAGNPYLTIFPAILSPADSNDFMGPAVPLTNFDRDSEYGYILTAPTWNFVPEAYNYQILQRVINPGSTSPTLSAPAYFQVPLTFMPFSSYPHTGNLFPTSNLLSTGPTQVPTGVIRKHQLYTAYGAQVDASGGPSSNPDRGIVIWMQLDLSGDSTGCSKKVETPTTVPVIVQSGTIEDTALVNPRTYWTTSIAVNAWGDVVITGNTTAADEYINVFYSARKRSDPRNTLRNPVFVTDNTSVPFNFGSPTPDQRWGDYSSVFVDPCNDVNFWLTNEVIGIENGWGVRATELIRLK